MIYEFKVRCPLEHAQELFEHITDAGEPVLEVDGEIVEEPEPSSAPREWLPGLGLER